MLNEKKTSDELVKKIKELNSIVEELSNAINMNKIKGGIEWQCLIKKNLDNKINLFFSDLKEQISDLINNTPNTSAISNDIVRDGFQAN